MRTPTCWSHRVRTSRAIGPGRPVIAGLWLLTLGGCASKERPDAPGEQPIALPVVAQRVSQGATARSPAALTGIDWSKVAEALGKSGTIQPGDVYKVGLPRADLHVTVDGVQVKPALALGSWVGFKQTGASEAVVMGDLVLLESELGSVIQKLQEEGIEQTAIHNHLLRESPSVMYVHIRGQGDPVKLAARIHAALALTKTPLKEGTATPDRLDLDTAEVNRALGRAGKGSGGVYQVSVPRAERVTEGGMEVPPSMGVATALNFQPTGDKRAAVTGDFVLIGSEVRPVLTTLKQNGIEVTALHNHMLAESPRLFFVHFWANDDALRLATGLRAALDKMNLKPRS